MKLPRLFLMAFFVLVWVTPSWAHFVWVAVQSAEKAET